MVYSYQSLYSQLISVIFVYHNIQFYLRKPKYIESIVLDISFTLYTDDNESFNNNDLAFLTVLWSQSFNYKNNRRTASLSQYLVTCMPNILHPYICTGSKEKPLYRDKKVAHDIWCDSNADKENWESL